jgi:hypothetical protein
VDVDVEVGVGVGVDVGVYVGGIGSPHSISAISTGAAPGTFML